MSEMKTIQKIISILDDHECNERDSPDTLDDIMNVIDQYQQLKIKELTKK